MIYPDKVYIPVVRGRSVWSVSEIDTAKAKKTPDYIVNGYIQYNGGLYSAGKVYTAAEIGSIREVSTK